MEKKLDKASALFKLSHPCDFTEAVIKQGGKETNTVRTWIKKQLLGGFTPVTRFQKCLESIERFSKSLELVYEPSQNKPRCRLVSNIYLPILRETLRWLAPEYIREEVRKKLLLPLQKDFFSTGKIDLDYVRKKITELLTQHKQLSQLLREKQVSQGVGVMRAESLEKHVLEAMDKLRSSILKDSPEIEGVYNLIENVFYERLRHARTYQIPGLFVNRDKPQGQQGEVRNIRVTILEPMPNDNRQVIYDFNITENEKGKKLRQSVESARKAAIRMVRESIPDIPDYVVKIEIEGNLEEIYEGGSLGLAVALTIFATATNQQIGIEAVGDLAVTGEIKSDDGIIGAVSGIPEKLEAALDAGISQVLLPENNVAEVTHIRGIQMHPVSHLKSLVTSGLLFDPWHGYCNAIIASYEPIELTSKTWQQLLKPKHKRMVVFRKFYAERETEAAGIVRQFSEQRLKVSEPFARRDIYVPILLDIKDFGHDSRFLDVVTATIFNLCKNAQVSPPESSIIERGLLDGLFVFVTVGLDNYESELPFFRAGGGVADLKLRYSQNKQIFVCQESSWERKKRAITDNLSFRTFSLYEKRSTFLDKYIVNFTEGNTDESPKLPLSLEQMQIPLTDFFFGKEDEKPLYMELLVRKIDQSGNQIVEPQLLSNVIKEGKERHILLLGDGGGGKTTLLQKIFFECTDKRGMLFSEGIVPILVNLGKLTSADREGLETLLKQMVKAERHIKISDELRDTNNLLLMFDGLNEVNKELKREGRKLAQSIRTYINSLEDENWIIIATRSHEALGEMSGLAYHILQEHSFNCFEILPVNLEVVREYLRQAAPGIMEKLWDRFGGRQANILQSPMLIDLLSTLSAESLSEEHLTKSLVYRQALNKWIERQWMRNTLQLFSESVEYRRAPHELWKHLACRMVEEHTNIITRQEAIEKLDNVKKSRPDWWPREILKLEERRISELRSSEVVLSELISGGLLKPIGIDRIKFLHDSIRDFFVAEALYKQREEITLSQLFDQKAGDREEYQKWRESLCFFVGLLETEELDDVIRWCREYSQGTQGTDFLADLFLETERFDLMEKAACDTSEVIRTTAIRYIYHLWNKEHARGLGINELSIIDNIAAKVNGWNFLRNRNTITASLESCIGLSGLILTRYPNEKPIIEYFRRLWHDILKRLRLIRIQRQGLIGQVRAKLHHLVIIWVGIKVIKRIFKSSRRNCNYENFKQFFKMSDDQRQKFIKILPYLNPKDKEPNEVADEIFDLVQSDNVLLWMTAFSPVYIKGIWDFESAMPLIQRLFEEGNFISKHCALISLCNIARYQSLLDERGEPLFSSPDERVAPLFLNYVRRYWEETGGGKVNLGGEEDVIDNFVWAGVYFQDANGRIELWDELFSIDGISDDVEVLKKAIEEIDDVGLRGFVSSALMTLETVFDRKDVEDVLVKTLAKLRNYSPSEVEYFLENSGTDGKRLLDEVLSSPTVDSLGDLMYKNTEDFLQWILLSQDTKANYMEQWLIELLGQGAQYKNVRKGLRMIVDRLLELITSV